MTPVLRLDTTPSHPLVIQAVVAISGELALPVSVAVLETREFNDEILDISEPRSEGELNR